MAQRYFQSHRGATVYTCGSCGIRTRETGEGESGCELCADCFYLCGEDNHYNDNGITPDAKEAATLQARLDNIKKKGGKWESVRDFCSYAFPA